MTKIFKITVTIFFVNVALYFLIVLCASFYLSYIESRDKFFKLFILLLIFSCISNIFLIASNITKYFFSNFWFFICFVDIIICFLIYKSKAEFLFASILIVVNSFVYIKVKNFYNAKPMKNLK